MLSTGSLAAPRSAVFLPQRSRSSSRAISRANALGSTRRRARNALASPIAASASRSSPSFLLDDDDAPPPTRTAEEYASLLATAEDDGDWVRAVELVAEARVLRVKLPAVAFEAAARAAAEHGDWDKAVAFLARAARSPRPSLAADGEAPPPPPPACSAIVAVFSRLAREVQAEATMELLEMLRGGGGEGGGGEGGGGEGRGDSPSSPSPPSSSPSPPSSSPPWRSLPAETRSIALNCAARACARASTDAKTMYRSDGDGSGGNDSKSVVVVGDDDRQRQLSYEHDRAIFFESSLRLLDDLREEALRIEDGTFGAVALAALAAGRPDLSEELLEERDYL